MYGTEQGGDGAAIYPMRTSGMTMVDAVRAPLSYTIARKIADASLRSIVARRVVRVGPRVIAALLGEVDDSHRQIAHLVDALGSAGDGLLACQRERNLMRDLAEKRAAELQRLELENQRLRERLAAQRTPEST